MPRRGTTLIEMLLVVLLTSMIMGTLATLYSYAMGRAAHSAARYTALEQANTLADAIETTVQQAVSCSIVTSGSFSGLKCIMPIQGVDRNGDGYIDRYSPTGVSRRGAEKFGYGKRVWFYTSNSTGAFTASGTVYWRAERSDDAVPTASDADKSFAYYFNTTTPRFSLVSSVAFSVDASTQLVTCTVNASSRINTERAATGSANELTESATVVKSIYWRNWRK
jgi:hypothetical protein